VELFFTVPALLKHERMVSIPCKGDRRLASAQDDEIILTLLPDFVAGARFLQEYGWRLPLNDM